MALRPSQAKQIEQALKGLEPEIRNAFMDAIRLKSNSVDLDQLIRFLEMGDGEAALEMLNLKAADLFRLSESIRTAYISGGPLIAGAQFSFDGRHPRAEAWVRSYAGDFIEGIIETTKAAARSVIESGLQSGMNPRSLVTDIVGRKVGRRRVGGFLGLNSNQSDSIIRGRGLLQSGIPSNMREYLDLELRDKSYDRIIKRAIRDSKPLTGKQLDAIIESHKSKALRHRGEVIARTESINALRAGRNEGLNQMVESGKIRDDQVHRFWDATMDARTRELHQEMNEQERIGTQTPFTTPDGYFMMFPGDTSLGAPGHHTIQCRCIERYEIDFMDLGGGK